ncbi:uncharacterized protein FFNC_15601 [Fusarium fujikuroi]|nr:uncharacterized protein FFNC_15601 [Fusarium fujikuroi]
MGVWRRNRSGIAWQGIDPDVDLALGLIKDHRFLLVGEVNCSVGKKVVAKDFQLWRHPRTVRLARPVDLEVGRERNMGYGTIMQAACACLWRRDRSPADGVELPVRGLGDGA